MTTIEELREEIKGCDEYIDDVVREIATQTYFLLEGGSERRTYAEGKQVYLVHDNEHNKPIYKIMQLLGLISDIQRKVHLIDLYGNPSFLGDVCESTPKIHVLHAELRRINYRDGVVK